MKLTKIHTWTTFVLGNIYASLIWATVWWEGLPLPTATPEQAPAAHPFHLLYVISGLVTAGIIVFIVLEWSKEFFNEDK